MAEFGVPPSARRLALLVDAPMPEIALARGRDWFNAGLDAQPFVPFQKAEPRQIEGRLVMFMDAGVPVGARFPIRSVDRFHPQTMAPRVGT